MDMILRKFIEGVANTRGEAFFQAIALPLNQVTAQLGGNVSLPPVSQGFALQYSFVDLQQSGHAENQLQTE